MAACGRKAQAEIDAEPENAFAWFNLGSSLTRLGELTGEGSFYENGAAAFDQAFILGLPPRSLVPISTVYCLHAHRPLSGNDRSGRRRLETQGGRNVEETYFYKGHALAFLGNGPEAAVAAYEQALRLNEIFIGAVGAGLITGGG